MILLRNIVRVQKRTQYNSVLFRNMVRKVVLSPRTKSDSIQFMRTDAASVPVLKIKCSGIRSASLY